MGPPIAPPKVLRSRVRRGICGVAWFENQSFAVKIVLRWYSKSDPRNWFVPLFVTRFTWAPAERPELAFDVIVVTRNSSTASEFRRSTGLLIEFVRASLMLTPSSVMLDWSLRAPATSPRSEERR